MPNYVENDLRIDIYEVDPSILTDLKECLAGPHGQIDFNKLIPYPDKFKEQDAAAKIEREKGNRSVKDGYNSGGYDWCVENWGTKWNAGAPIKIEEEDDCFLIYHFDTAWSPPMPIVVEISKRFPVLEFALEYFESGIGINGRFVCKGGEVVSDENGKYFGRRGG